MQGVCHRGSENHLIEVMGGGRSRDQGFFLAGKEKRAISRKRNGGGKLSLRKGGCAWYEKAKEGNLQNALQKHKSLRNKTRSITIEEMVWARGESLLNLLDAEIDCRVR